MRFIIQRVSNSKVTIDNEIRGQIGKGFMVLIGVGESDTKEIADKMMKASEYIDHVYPGADTRRYINKIVLRLTVFGTLYLILFTALPFSLLLWDKDLLRLTMIPGTFLMFVGMIYNIREEIRALRVNQRYTRIF